MAIPMDLNLSSKILRLGLLNLQVPQVRESNFYPSFLERGLRSERALSLSLAEMYIQGVSTRKVRAILEEMCGFELTSIKVFHFQSSHRQRLKTSNLAERVNREIKRQTKIASIFERLVTGELIEISEDWESGKAYLSMDE